MFYQKFKLHVDSNPKKIAVQCGDQSVSYEELDHKIWASVEYLSSVGIKQDHRLAVFFNSNVDYLSLFFASSIIGAVVVPIELNLGGDEVSIIVEDCRADFFVIDKTLDVSRYKNIAGAAKKIPIIEYDQNTTSGIYRESINRNSFGVKDSNKLLVIQYTSGTTGKPKGIAQTNQGLTSRMVNWGNTATITASDKILCCLTLTHAHGSDILAFPALTHGATLFLVSPTMATPLRMLNLINKRGITFFSGLPFMYQLMADFNSKKEFDLSKVRHFVCTSAPLSEQIYESFYRKYGRKISNSYGLSEIGMITSNLYKTNPENVLSIGPLIKGVESKISESGELWVKSENLAWGYVNEKDGPMLEDGWLKTGDIVSTDVEGNYSIVGRISQFINVSGNKVSPIEIESCIKKIDGVKDVAVVGKKVKNDDDVVVAFIETVESSVIEKSIRKYCQVNLASYKCPEFYVLTNQLPRTELGKIQKSKLSI